MLAGSRAEDFAAPGTTETTQTERNLCRIGADMDMGAVDAGLETFCGDPVAALCTVEDLPRIGLIYLLLRENPGDLLGAQLVEEGSDDL